MVYLLKMVIFYSYVKLPEGNHPGLWGRSTVFWISNYQTNPIQRDGAQMGNFNREINDEYESIIVPRLREDCEITRWRHDACEQNTVK
jgi:hypothetical protein